MIFVLKNSYLFNYLLKTKNCKEIFIQCPKYYCKKSFKRYTIVSIKSEIK